MVKPPARWKKKYVDRATVATDDYKFGVEHPVRSQMEAAIAGRKTLEAKMAKKETWDKWQEGLEYVGDEGWRKGCIEKGVDRYAPGVRVGADKYSEFAEKFSEHLKVKVEEIRKLPKITIEDSIKRAAEMIRHNAAFRFKRRR
jgi:hypothetical protein